MKLIVGLGNPGRFYDNTRHNIGSSVVKALAKTYQGSFKKESKTFSLVCKIKLSNKRLDEHLLLAIPLTYMNASGPAVSFLVNQYKIDINDLLIVCDDLHLQLGRIKIKPAGSSGGHRGLQSIIEALETERICRLRVGIGKPAGKKIDVADYVLSNLRREEKTMALSAIKKACECAKVWVNKGLVECMNMFNKKVNERNTL